MPSIGETLREARMRQQLDIADVEARTKIRAKYLRALENEDFGVLPGGTFVKTFLRTYAEVLGLDPHVLVEEYRANFESPDELEVQPLGRPGGGGGGGGMGRERRYPPGPPRRGVVVVLAIVAVLAFLIVLGVTGNDDNEGSKSASRSTETAKQKRPVQRQPPRPRAVPTAVTLQITPDGPVYVCLDTGPGTEHVFEGTISDPRTFKRRRLRLNLGRTAVQMKVNGKAFPVEPVANPVGFEFSPRGSKPLPPAQRPCV
jgi:cytoskeletal protein RodZ